MSFSDTKIRKVMWIKLTTIVLSIFLFVSKSYSQTEAYRIQYVDKRYFDRKAANIPVTANLPESFDKYMLLETTNYSSQYVVDKETSKKERKKKELAGEKRRWWRKRNENEVLFKSLEEESYTHKSNLFGKDFLVIDTLQVWKWKISAGEQREVSGYICMKATYKDSTTLMEAWFTPQIPISNGPAEFGGLPGLVLEMRLENRNIVAKNVEKIVLDKEFEIPDKGEVVTREEFDKIKEEKKEERKKMWGGAGRRKF